MAKARRCDRCGKFFMPEELQEYFKNDEPVYTIVNSVYWPNESNLYDLCPACYRGLKVWMEAGK